MFDYIHIGATPADEPCLQAGSDRAKQIKECSRFRDQLRRQFGPEPDGAALVIKSNEHDFGVYFEVVCKYDGDKQDAVDYAYRCEGEAWEDWRDSELIEEVAALG